MDITFDGKSFPFRPWRPADGRVLGDVFAFDTETELIDEDRDWLVPAYVLGAAFDGRVGCFVTRDHVAGFLAAHPDADVVMHHAPFDLAVLDAVAPGAGVYDRVDVDSVYDTRLLHQLHALAVSGHTASGKGESSLERCARVHLGVALPKDVRDAAGREVRLSYGQWLHRPASEIDPVYLDYLARDAVVTFKLFIRLYSDLTAVLAGAAGAWGYVSPDWLRRQSDAWGPQTHHIQLKAAVALRAVTAKGLTLDRDAQGVLAAQLEARLHEQREALRLAGYLPGGAGSDRALQAILRHLEAETPGVEFPRTPTGKYATSRADLAEFAGRIPFLADLAAYKATEKLLGAFVGKLRKPVVHPSFHVLVRSGRTASFGDLNAQNLPRDDAVRGCFVPSAGHVFVKADYATVEMATLAQAVIGQFGQRSAMADAINAGRDLHRLVAARVTGKAEADVTDDERQMAKPINFGKPGAMGDPALRQYARASYRVDLTDQQVAALSAAWDAEFPEMVGFLRPDRDAGVDVAAVFGLTPLSHHEHTGSRKFLDHPANEGRAERPHPILGPMLLRTLRDPVPVSDAGRPYHPADIDYFWSRVEARLDVLPAKLHPQVRGRRASPALRAAVGKVAGRAAVFTLTGRLRAGASFAARRNTTFQGLAADGAKVALWKLFRAGYRVVNFVHDEFLVEVPACDPRRLRAYADDIRRLMVEGMRAVVPDVTVGVEYAACDRWYKKAKPVTSPDRVGLELWRPTPPPQPGSVESAT